MQKSIRRKIAVQIVGAMFCGASDAFAAELVPPKLEVSIEPVYPSEKQSSGESAHVTLLLTIAKDGSVSDASVTNSAGEAFDAASLQAARKLRFVPATRDGTPIVAKIPFSFDFAVAAPAPAEPAADVVPATAAPKPAEPVPPLAADEPVEISVAGQRAPREATKHVLEGAEIRKVPGTGGDSLRAIESMPGVARPPGTAGILIVRGAAPQDTQVLVDGTWIPSAYHFGGITSVLPTDVISKIDFYPGNYSSEFGRALGGIVDVGLRSPRKDRIGGLAQFDLLDGRVMAEGPITPNTRFLLAARRSWVDAWISPALEATGQMVRTAPVYWDGQAVLEYDLSSKTTARLAFFGSDDRMALTIEAPVAGDPTFGGSFGQHSRFWRAQLRIDTKLSDSTRWISMLSYGENSESVSIGSNRVETNLPIANARSDFRTKLAPGLHAIAGVDALWTAYDVTIKFPPIVGDDPVGPFFGRPAREIHGDGAVIRPGMYAMLDWAPVPSVRLIPGVRADWTPDTGRLDVDPRLSARWDVLGGDARTTLKGALGAYHQAPLQEAVKPWGDGTARSSASYHASLGIERVFTPQIELSVEGFYKRLDDLIVQRADAFAPAGVAYKNTGSGNVYGLESMLRYKPGGRFFGWVAYTLSRSERRDDDTERYALFQWDQTHILTALGSYDLGRGWNLGARFRYTSGTPYTPFTGGVVDLDAGAYEPVIGRKYAARTTAFHELSIRAEKSWTVGPTKLAAYLDIRNAYNRQNADGVVYSYDYARSAPVAGLPILPIVGLRGEL